jgi:hypothetical protein
VQSSSLSHRNLLLDIPTVGISVDIKARRHSIACDQQCVKADERYDVGVRRGVCRCVIADERYEVSVGGVV